MCRVRIYFKEIDYISKTSILMIKYFLFGMLAVDI